MKRGLIFLILLLFLFPFILETLAIAENNTVELKIYFYNQEDCLIEIPYSIKVDGFSKAEIIRKVVERLLEGPGRGDLFSFIPEGTKLNHVVFFGKNVILDFSKELQSYGGGSFNVLHIREQLENTLMQFLFIEGIIFTVEGRGEKDGVLQP